MPFIDPSREPDQTGPCEFHPTRAVPESGMDSVRIGISGAAPLSTALLAWYQGLGIEILEGYAMSENFAYSHSTPLGESKIGYVGCARPHRGFTGTQHVT